MYPPSSAAWRRILVPTFGALASGYLLYRYFPDAPGRNPPSQIRAVHPQRLFFTKTVLAKLESTVRDVLDPEAMYPYVHADDPVSYALERMREGGADVLPVVSRAGIHNIIGVIGLREILESYGVPTAKFFSRSTPA